MQARPAILVTGGTGVLGSAIVAALRARDQSVVANFWRDENRAQTLAARTGCALWRADARDESAVERMFGAGAFGAVIHAAGANRDALLLRTSPANWRAQLRWSDAAFLVTRASLEHLPRGGRLLLIASRVGERGNLGQSAYAASKGALIGLMRAAAAERRDLSINAICPGYAPSDLASLGAFELEKRASQNVLSGADARESLAALCVWALGAAVSGQVWRPDCRI